MRKIFLHPPTRKDPSVKRVTIGETQNPARSRLAAETFVSPYVNRFLQNVHSNGKLVDPSLDLVETEKNEENRLRQSFISERESPELNNLYLGLIPLYSPPDPFRQVAELNNVEKETPKIFDLDRTFDLLNKPNRRKFPGEPAFVDEAEFKKNFSLFTNGILDCLNWDNLFLAGGCVSACVLPIPEEFQ